MTESEIVVAAKVGGAAGFGSAVALRFLPGTWWQRVLSFMSSLGIGCLAGGAAVERFLLVPGSYTHMLAVASAAVFGLAIVNNAMQQIPEILTDLRRRFLAKE
ncbi:hypothetical protein HI806_09590 [Ralstonia solanacearum]|uniref:hypothetical protein n=1 Tax=Ralstonia pseudosolanacearum TaxID=1310165 RepID=UPI0002DC8034|nr:hypothetical protein BCR16_09250 [Ralstonia solanacearum FJAT-1458]QKL71517.1 hypothetical protein HI806_09590 [Ralstonia solanacearum]QKL76726.1 hypothetical protein HI805_09600 [Ralstonia solanacearum]QKL81930.1 hypothetical protein HI804_09600 [Ralstonia solanacearum]QKL87141.1 hypothetical protein HI803_09605 [Ralstonia solanacearum]